MARTAQLSLLRTPTLVVYGEADSPYTGAKTTDRIASTLPDAKAVCVRESGHWPFLENPDKFRRIIEDFLFVENTPVTS